MEPMDLITMILLILGLVWGLGMLIILRRSKSKPKLLPRIYGLGIGVYAFVSLMITSVLRRPISELLNFSITNLFLSVSLGIIGYFSGRIIERRKSDKE